MSALEASEHAGARPRDEKLANTATARSRKSTRAATEQEAELSPVLCSAASEHD